MNYQKKTATSSTPGKEAVEGVGARFIVDVLLDCAPTTSISRAGAGASGEEPKPVPCPRGAAGGELRVLPVLLPNLDGISSVRMFIPKVGWGGVGVSLGRVGVLVFIVKLRGCEWICIGCARMLVPTLCVEGIA